MNKRMFVTDLDGTLMTDAKTISSRDLASLTRLRRNGIVTVLATGRSDHSLEKALALIGLGNGQGVLPVDYVLFSTGAGILKFPERRLVESQSLIPEEVRAITAYLDFARMDYMVHQAIPHTRRFVYQWHGEPNPDFKARLALYADFGRPLDPISRLTESATEILVILPAGTETRVIETLRKDLSDFSVIQATSPLDHASVWMEIFPKKVSKSGTAAFLSEQLAVQSENVIAVGNDYNDEDLLAWSGKGFVVDNAPPDLRSRYETVASNNASGVSMAAERSGWLC